MATSPRGTLTPGPTRSAFRFSAAEVPPAVVTVTLPMPWLGRVVVSKIARPLCALKSAL